MIGRLLAFVVAALLVQGVAYAQKGEASFHCVVKSAYYMDRDDQPVPVEKGKWERTKIDVLVHNGKAMVTHQLFGFSWPQTEEFSILQLGGANNSWRLQWHAPAPLANDPDTGQARTITINIRTWGLKDLNTPIRLFLLTTPN